MDGFENVLLCNLDALSIDPSFLSKDTFVSRLSPDLSTTNFNYKLTFNYRTFGTVKSDW